ncbi:hypothetical protein [Sphingomonas mesophila]|uniref:hypothetical protein n=1 Tax=Sphingomonas mesophila TaxID=2303576 RepID=UPI0013C2B7C5|nr:hypothetical protein [Sphingomonas mesophila]
MKNIYNPVTLERHPVIGDDFYRAFDAGNLAPVYDSPEGARLLELLTSVHGICALVGAVSAAPTKPPMPAVEGMIRDQLGADVLCRHDMKQLTGRALRQIVEYLGGEWEGRGTPITVTSQFTKGSTYSFPDFQRREKKRREAE